LSEAESVLHEQAVNVIALDDALTTLAEINLRQSEIVEMRFFGGLSIEEAAKVLGVSPGTVMRDWTFARAWLLRELREQ
jgi:RNA polymerase sigma factor (sigma-70 family)